MSRPEQDASALAPSFESQRDQLVQEITAAMDSVVYNLDILNRSLKDSIQVGNGFQDASRLWATFYDGATSDAKSNDAPRDEPKETNIAPTGIESPQHTDTTGGQTPDAEVEHEAQPHNTAEHLNVQSGEGEAVGKNTIGVPGGETETADAGPGI